MSKKSDDSIERIFRQAVTQYDATFQASDWLKMEKLLDEEVMRRAAARSKRIKGTAFSLTGLTGLIIAVYFLAFNNPSDSTAKLNGVSTEEQAAGNFQRNGGVKSENSPDGLLSSEDSAGVLPNQQKTKTVDRTAERSSKNKNRTSSSLASGAEKLNSAPIGKDKITTSENKLNPAPLSRQHVVAKDNKVQSFSDARSTSQISNRPISPTDFDGEISIADQSVKTQKDESEAQRTNSSLAKSSGIHFSDSASTRPVSKIVILDELNSPAKSKEESVSQTDSLLPDNVQGDIKIDSLKENSKSVTEAQQKNKPASRWSIGIIFAPEFSTTRLNHYSTPGESIGLRVGYQLSNRFNINTGIIRSTKKYKDEGSEYSPNPGYWRNRTNGVVPEEIDSKCVVYELPVDVQFDLIQTTKSRLFIATAVVSYFMMSQAYQYNFEAPNPGAASSWESSSSESYWLGVAMISAGYERNIHRSLSLGIEPYLKTSLIEIGWPNIKLFSAGAYVTLRYKFHPRNSRAIE